MDEINKIRKAFFTNGESKHAIALRMNRSWETIHKIVSQTREKLEGENKRPNRKSKLITADVLKAIHSFLDEEVEKKVKKKQRYTAKKIYTELRSNGIYKGSIRLMRYAIKRVREERNQSKNSSYLPLSFPLGSVLQVDHGEVDLMIDGQRFTGYLFVASVPEFVLRYCQIFPTKSREAWGEFHERAFRYFGGIFNRVVYDNDSVLVKKIIGSDRHQTTFSLSLEEHFGFESHFCNVAAGNEKGSVENAVGYCRRNHLSGTPSFIDWDEVNRHLEMSCNNDIVEGKNYKTNKSLFPAFESLKEILGALPPRKNWSKPLNCRVDSCQLISIDHHQYSVPEKYVGSYVTVRLGVFQVKIFKDEELIAIHQRQYVESGSLKLDHYLDQLHYKASAFWDCKAVQSHKFDQSYLEMWRRLSEKFEKKEANRQLVKILILGRRYPQANLLLAVKQALKYEAISYDAVENILRQPDATEQEFDQKALQNMLTSVDIHSWEFDLARYAELCVGVKL